PRRRGSLLRRRTLVFHPSGSPGATGRRSPAALAALAAITGPAHPDRLRHHAGLLARGGSAGGLLLPRRAPHWANHRPPVDVARRRRADRLVLPAARRGRLSVPGAGVCLVHARLTRLVRSDRHLLRPIARRPLVCWDHPGVVAVGLLPGLVRRAVSAAFASAL